MRLCNYFDKLSDDIRLVDVSVVLRKMIKQKGVPLKEVSQRTNVPYRSLMNYLSGSRSIPLKLCRRIIGAISSSEKEQKKMFDHLYDVAEYATSVCSHAKVVNIPKIFDEHLAYIIGALHDGCVYSNESRNQYVVQIVQHSNQQWLCELAKSLSKVFGIQPKVYRGYLQIANKFVFEFFAKVIGIPRYHVDWDCFLKGKSWEIQKRMISGMFDAEGWIGNKEDVRLKFSQKNHNKLREIKEVLNSKGIRSGRVLKENDAHALFICGKNCLNFIDEVGVFSKHPKKLAKFRELRSQP